MAKVEEKAKVGRPKLADQELIKESWFNIGSCLVVALVMVVCGTHSLTGKTPLDFIKSAKLQGNVAEVTRTRVVNVSDGKVKIVKVIKPERQTKKVIRPNGETRLIIPIN